ncbi:MAG: DeoR/GlpR family DNA-binding transcription regulator [Sphaerochaetaceae bacterium]|nr:DeoR/GlpR family DNA-binding transcription regulator [Sphaerochaetaceae bacterium]
MIPIQRHNKILELLAKNEIMSYAELAEILQVSQMTVRRDVNILEKNHRLTSVPGGISLSTSLLSEPSHLVKLSLSHKQKEEISKLAVEQISNQVHIIYLDAGTTCLEIAHNLVDKENLIVVSNDFEIIRYLLLNTQLQLIHIGGDINRENLSSVGPLAAEMIDKINIDLAFISTSSWDIRGLSSPDPAKIPVKKSIIKVSKMKILVTDSSKYGQIAPYFVFPLTELDKIITDRELPKNSIREIEEQGIHVIN